MATGIKIIKRISRPFPEQTRLLLLNALVISQLHYSGLLLASSKNNCFITLEKQLSWAVKTCFNRKKYDSSSDLKPKHQILPIKFLLEHKVLNYFMKYTSNQLPIFKKLHLPTSNLRYSQRTKKYCFNHKINSFALESSILIIGSTLHNKFLNVSFFKKIIEMDARPIALKKHLKMFFFHLYKQNSNNASYGKASWKSFGTFIVPLSQIKP